MDHANIKAMLNQTKQETPKAKHNFMQTNTEA